MEETDRVGSLAVLGAYWLVSAGTLGFQYGVAALLPDLLDAFGATRAATAAAAAMCVGTLDLSAALVGYAVGRFGERAVCFAGGCAAGAGLLAASVAAHVAHLWPAFFLLGAGHALALWSAVVAANKSFDGTRRTRAHAVANTGAAAGPLLLGSLWSALSDRVGLKGALRVLALADLAILCCAAWWLVVPAAGAPVDGQNGEGARPRPFRELVRDADVRRLSLVILLFGLGMWVLPVHVVRLALDHGHSDGRADRLVVCIGFGSLLVRVPVAWVADRVLGRRVTFAACGTCYAAVIMLVLGAPGRYGALAGAAFLVGGLVGSMLSLMPTLPPEVVPAADMGAATTLVCSTLGFGSLGGPMMAGAVFDRTGSYDWALVTAAACLLASAAVLLPPRRGAREAPGGADVRSLRRDDAGPGPECT